MIVRLVTWLLRLNLSDKHRHILVNAVINSLDMPPIRAIITTDENRRVLVQGKLLSPEQEETFREGAYAATNNTTLKLVRDQVRFAAIDQGFLQSNDTKTQLFYKAALWYAQEEARLLAEFSS